MPDYNTKVSAIIFLQFIVKLTHMYIWMDEMNTHNAANIISSFLK